MYIYLYGHGELTGYEDIGRLQRIPDRRQGNRGLSKSEINTLKKSQLFSYEELSWYHKAPFRPSQQSSVELRTLANEDTESIVEKNYVFQDVELKQEIIDNPSNCDCAICLEEMKIGDWYKKLPRCEHCFHAKCIDQWLSTRETCPVCREEVVIPQDALGLSAVGLDEKVSS